MNFEEDEQTAEEIITALINQDPHIDRVLFVACRMVWLVHSAAPREFQASIEDLVRELLGKMLISSAEGEVSDKNPLRRRK